MNLATGELLKEATVMHSLLDDLPQGEQVAEDLRRSYVSIQATIEVLAQRTRTGGGGAGAVYQLDKMLERRSRLLDDVRAYLAANSGTAALLDAEQGEATNQINNHMLTLVNDLRMMVQDCVREPEAQREMHKRLRDLFLNRYAGKFSGTVKDTFDRLRANLG